MIRSLLRRLGRPVRHAREVIGNLPRLRLLLSDPEVSQTYYPDEPRKSKFRILWENLLWLLRYREINYFYYVWGFDRVHGPDQSEYCPYALFKDLRSKANQCIGIAGRTLDYRCLLRDKFVFCQYLTALGFPTPRIVAVCDKNTVMWPGSRRTEPIEAIQNLGRFTGFAKEILGECADAVYPLDIQDGQIILCGRPASLDELRTRIAGKIIVQESIGQHPEMAKFHPQSVNTLRFTTVVKDGRPEVFAAFVKFGAGDSKADNWATGGLLGGVDIPTGRIAKAFVFKPGHGGRATHHPDSGLPFEGFTIPLYRQALETTLALHQCFYGVHSIGWDIAITPDGPCFIEGNDNWEISATQVYGGGQKKAFLACLPRR